MSEKFYWFFLVVIFGVFALLIWFWLVPNSIVEYNLGVNLLTSSIFMVLTVIFLSYLSDLRQQNDWKTVKERVYDTISWHIKSITSYLTDFLDFPSELLFDFPIKGQWLPIGGKVDIAFKKSLIAQMEYLSSKDGEEISLSNYGKKYLRGSKGSRLLKDFCIQEIDIINNIEAKYAKFLKPSLISLLMQLETDLYGIVDLISVKDHFENYLSLIVHPIHTTIKVIHKIHKTEIEIHPPQIP